MNPIRELPTRRLAIIVGEIAILAILFPTLFSILFASDDELSVSADVSISSCLDLFIDSEDEAQNCISSYKVVLGNTGTVAHEMVILHLGELPPLFQATYRSLNIVASASEIVQPEIRFNLQADALTYEIGNLVPNRLVEINFLTRGVDAYRALSDIRVSVIADGTLIDANPHLTVASRFVRNLFGVFGL